ncbi:MAG: hypothetical protein H6Q00_2340 [Holophagaceae bacterium]|nr:hypothetical protein [Holophagaceae bacterium]
MLNEYFSSIASILRKSRAPAPSWKQYLVAQGAIRGLVAGVDRLGKGLVAWDNDGELWSARINASRILALAKYPLGEGHSPTLSVDGCGKGMLVWLSGPAGREEVMAATVNPGGEIDDSHFCLSTSGPVQHLQVAVDRRGGAIALWLQEGASGWEVRVQTHDGRKGTWEKESTRLGLPDPIPTRPHLIMNRQGLAMAIWQVREGDFEGPVVAYNWPHERIWSDRLVRISDHITTELTACLDNQGNALACWVHRRHGEQALLEASFYSANACEWSAPRRLASAPGLFQLRMGMDPVGDSLLTWRQKENAGNDHLLGKACHEGEWQENALRTPAGPEYLSDYALMKRGAETTLLLLPVRGGAVIHRMRAAGWDSPVYLAPDLEEIGAHPLLLSHSAGMTALWLSGSVGHVRLMSASEA